MGKKDRIQSSKLSVQATTNCYRPVFTDDPTLDFIKHANNIMMINAKGYLFHLTPWTYAGKEGPYYSKWFWLKIKARQLLGLPVSSNDPRDLVTWRWSRK